MTENLSSGGSSRTTSTVWSHFTLVEESTKAQCNYCDAKYKRASGNTTNLHKHLQRKHPSKVEYEAESTGEMDKFRYTATIFREFITKWIVCDDQPFTVVENEQLQKIFRLLFPNIKTISADTARNDIIDAFKEERNKIQNILQVVLHLHLMRGLLQTSFHFSELQCIGFPKTGN
uniref:BED-type domain-containing protein n=1 Tax=Rhizophagus irregularis (strain DAOM 181602 / DAOM 197198 / MUCL 43194) TaxID=747089 RepID=U9T1U4_RHIID